MKLSTKIKLALRSIVMNAGSVETDKAVLQYEGDELKVGDEVFVEVEGEVLPAEDGDYVAEGKTIVVADGKVTEIREDEKAEDEVQISAAKQKFEKVKSFYEETYEEKTQKIYTAISNLLGHNDFWVREAADDFVIVEIWSDEDDTYKDYRFDVSWDEEGNATVSNQVEVKETFVPADDKPQIDEQFEEEPKPADEPETKEEEEVKTTDEKVADLTEAMGDMREGIEQLTNAVANLVGRLEKLENKIASLEEPAADPAEEGEETEVKASRLSYLRK